MLRITGIGFSREGVAVSRVIQGEKYLITTFEASVTPDWDLVQRWAEDPLEGGSFCYQDLELLGSVRKRQPKGDVKTLCGLCEGAIATGRVEVSSTEILERLKRDLLSVVEAKEGVWLINPVAESLLNSLGQLEYDRISARKSIVPCRTIWNAPPVTPSMLGVRSARRPY
jgi:hypothetical protein